MKKRICKLCRTEIKDRICPNVACKSIVPSDVIFDGDTNYTCPLCGGEVLYIGATPPALECPTKNCPNYKKY